MSSTSSRPKSLKRLSLLQSPTVLSSPSSSSFGSPDVASKRVDIPSELADGGAHPSPASSVSSPTTCTRTANEAARKNARRQSSIYYVSQDRDAERTVKDVRSPVNEQRFSSLQENNSNNTSSEVNVKRRSLGSIDEQAAPATLAEKHADLLRFIAQKESRCLELRSQLAAEEAELLTLKRKWERIVNRRVKGESSASISSLDTEPPAQNNVLTGLKEGVQGVGRLLAQLSDLGAQNRETDTGHASNSSISTMTTSSSTRLSQSSVSSFGLPGDGDSTDCAKVPSDPPEVGAKRHSLSMPVRRRPYEPASPGTPSPPILTPQTPLSASFAYSEASAPKLSRSQTTTMSQKQAKHMKRLSGAAGSFPPASSIPGVSVAPFASWVEDVGKRLVEQVISGSGTSSNSSKRASKGLSFSALTSPTPSSAHVIDLSTPDSPSLLDDDDGPGAQWTGITTLTPERPKLVSVSSPSVASQKDEDGDGKGKTFKGSGTSAKAFDDDSEEWNW